MTKKPLRAREIALCFAAAVASSVCLEAYFGMLFGGTAAMIACFFLYTHACLSRPMRSEVVGSLILGGLFSAMRVLGYSYENIDSYGLVMKNMGTLTTAALSFLALTLTAGSAVLLLINLFERISASSATRPMLGAAERYIRRGERRKTLLLCAAMIFAGAIPYLILYAPGLNIFDTHDQILQFFGYPSYIGDGSVLTDHHPVFLTVVYGLFMKMGLLLGNANLGQLLYSFVSMAALAAGFACVLGALYDAGLSRRALLGIAALIAVYPVFGLYAFNMCKDVSVEPFVLFYTAQLIRLETSRGEAAKRPLFLAGLFANMLLMMLTRKPSMYALAFAAPFLLIRYKGVRIRLAAVMIGAVALFHVGYTGVLLPAAGVVPGETREMLSIPFQMTARYLRTYEGDVTPEELADISRVIDVEHAKAHYDPRLSDPVKDTTNPDMTGEDLKAYLGAFVKMGLRHPGVYLDAWLNMIYGYFYPSESNTIVCLTLNNPNQGGVNLTHTFDWDEARLWLHDFIYFRLRRIPAVGPLFYVDTVTWAFLFVLLVLILRRGVGGVLPLMFFFGTLGICMLSPKSGEIRYLMPILYALPGMIGWAMIPHIKTAPHLKERKEQA
ncbi:MAG: hypothetical protein J6M47_02250 [Clostridia bacterium]|nr:hypothetical protein [Clostridia bacterium]